MGRWWTRSPSRLPRLPPSRWAMKESFFDLWRGTRWLFVPSASSITTSCSKGLPSMRRKPAGDSGRCQRRVHRLHPRSKAVSKECSEFEKVQKLSPPSERTSGPVSKVARREHSPGTIREQEPLGPRARKRLTPVEDAKITAKDRPRDRKLSRALGRSVHAIQQRRSCLP